MSPVALSSKLVLGGLFDFVDRVESIPIQPNKERCVLITF